MLCRCCKVSRAWTRTKTRTQSNSLGFWPLCDTLWRLYKEAYISQSLMHYFLWRTLISPNVTFPDYRPLQLNVLFSKYRSRYDIFKIVFLLPFHSLCSYTRAENEISKGHFPRVSRRGLHLGKQIYKLRSGLALTFFHSCTCFPRNTAREFWAALSRK